jgi:glycerol-1-phosphate dehydrogenase [NAD(P)+]
MSVGAAALDLDALRARLAGSHEAARLSPIGLRAVRAGPDAIHDLAAIVENLVPPGATRRVVLLSDAVTKCRGNEDVGELSKTLLGDFETRSVVLGGASGGVHADAATVGAAIRGAAGARCLVTVGSGTVADVGKVAAARHDIPHVVVQTATSVNGFADDKAVLLIKGVKETTQSRWPDELVIDTQLLAGAPAALNLAGIGDLAAMFTAPADWQLGCQIGMADGYSAVAVAITRERGAEVLDAAAGVAGSDQAAIATVASVLTLSGISMGVAGTTAPSSGMEHTVSHLIDMAMYKRGVEAALHGAQVGVSTVVAATLWHRVIERLAAGGVTLRSPGDGEMARRVRSAFAPLDPSGTIGEECWRLYSRKLTRWVANRDRLQRLDWDDVANSARELLVEPAMLCDALAAGAAPVRFSQLDPPIDGSLVRWALLNCHLMRERFSIADLAFMLGMWEASDVDSVLDEAAAAGGGA